MIPLSPQLHPFIASAKETPLSPSTVPVLISIQSVPPFVVRRQVPLSPTASAVPASITARPRRLSVSPSISLCQVFPRSKLCSTVPLCPTAQASAAPDQATASSMLPCGSGFVHFQAVCAIDGRVSATNRRKRRMGKFRLLINVEPNQPQTLLKCKGCQNAARFSIEEKCPASWSGRIRPPCRFLQPEG